MSGPSAQATKAGIGFTELDNGFATADDPAGLQAICDRLGPGAIRVFCERWWARLPLPLTDADRAGGYWWDIAMRQVEVSRTIVFDAPRHARGLLRGAVSPTTWTSAARSRCEVIFGRQVRTPHPGDVPHPAAAPAGTRSPSTPTSGIPG